MSAPVPSPDALRSRRHGLVPRRGRSTAPTSTLACPPPPVAPRSLPDGALAALLDAALDGLAAEADALDERLVAAVDGCAVLPRFDLRERTCEECGRAGLAVRYDPDGVTRCFTAQGCQGAADYAARKAASL